MDLYPIIWTKASMLGREHNEKPEKYIKIRIRVKLANFSDKFIYFYLDLVQLLRLSKNIQL